MTLAIALSLAVLLAVSLFFVFCHRYEEGIFGNLALAAICISCVLLLRDLMRGELVIPVDSAWTVLLMGVALFLTRYAYRVVMFHWHAKFGWRPPRDVDCVRQAET